MDTLGRMGDEAKAKGEGETKPDDKASSSDDKTNDSSDSASEKTAEGKGGDTANDKSGRPEDGAPDKYEAFTSTEGFEWSEDSQAGFEALAKKQGLNQGSAQEMFDFFAEHVVGQVTPGLLKAQEDKIAASNAEQLENAHKNKYVGGEAGELWDASVAQVKRVLAHFDREESPFEGGTDALSERGYLDDEFFLALMKGVSEFGMPGTLDPHGDPGASTDWSDKPLREKLNWGKNALPKDGVSNAIA